MERFLIALDLTHLSGKEPLESDGEGDSKLSRWLKMNLLSVTFKAHKPDFFT